MFTRHDIGINDRSTRLCIGKFRKCFFSYALFVYSFNGEISMEYFNVGVSISGFAMNGLFFLK